MEERHTHTAPSPTLHLSMPLRTRTTAVTATTAVTQQRWHFSDSVQVPVYSSSSRTPWLSTQRQEAKAKTTAVRLATCMQQLKKWDGCLFCCVLFVFFRALPRRLLARWGCLRVRLLLYTRTYTESSERCQHCCCLIAVLLQQQ